MHEKTVLACVALICATIVECFALSLGINGYVLGGYMLIVGSCAGVPVGQLLEKRRVQAPSSSG